MVLCLALLEPSGVAEPPRWNIPAGSGTMVRWLVEPGAALDHDRSLLLLRTADGTLTRLSCGTATGQLVEHHADAGDVVIAGQWLATIRMGSAEPAPPSSLAPVAPTPQPCGVPEPVSRPVISGFRPRGRTG